MHKNTITKAEAARRGLRWCADLQMFALERGCDSCKHSTRYCRATCYNRKFLRYPSFRKTWGPDGNDNKRWDGATTETFGGLSAVRLCTRGEPLATMADVRRLRDWAVANPECHFWVPTRGWRDACVRREIRRYLRPLANVHVVASIDPTTPLKTVQRLQRGGWSTMYYGEHVHPNDTGDVHRCRKTWGGVKGACAECAASGDGCFSEERVDIFLKKH